MQGEGARLLLIRDSLRWGGTDCPLLFGPSTTVPSASPPGSPATAHHVLLPSPRLPCILSLCRFSPRRTRSPASVVCAVWVCLLARGGLASRDLSQPQRFFNPPPEMNWPWVFCFWSTRISKLNAKGESNVQLQIPRSSGFNRLGCSEFEFPQSPLCRRRRGYHRLRPGTHPRRRRMELANPAPGQHPPRSDRQVRSRKASQRFRHFQQHHHPSLWR